MSRVNGTRQPIDELDRMYDERDSCVRILYKFRSCNPNSFDLLRTDRVWFSTPPQLNDPFDCAVRLPTSISAEDIDAVRVGLASAKPYNVEIHRARQVADYAGGGRDFTALMPLGLMASQFRHQRLLNHIRRIEANSEAWVRDLIVMAREVAEVLLANITVFCVSEHKDHPLMWAHYGVDPVS